MKLWQCCRGALSLFPERLAFFPESRNTLAEVLTGECLCPHFASYQAGILRRKRPRTADKLQATRNRLGALSCNMNCDRGRPVIQFERRCNFMYQPPLQRLGHVEYLP